MDPTGPNIGVYSLIGRSANPTTALFQINDTSIERVNGLTNMYYTRPIAAGTHPVSLTSVNYLIASMSDSTPVQYHGDTKGSVTVTDLKTFGAVQDTVVPTSIWRIIHGSIMFGSWGVLLTFGMLFARYAKHFEGALWFKVHRVTQYGGYLLACVGFAFAFVAGSGNHYYYLFHSSWGTAIMALGMAQVLGGFFRPHKEPGEKTVTNARRLFEYFHWWNGRTMVLMVVVQVITGLFIIYNNEFDLVIIIYIAAAALVMLIVVILEIMVCACPPREWQTKRCCYYYADDGSEKYYELSN